MFNFEIPGNFVALSAEFPPKKFGIPIIPAGFLLCCEVVLLFVLLFLLLVLVLLVLLMLTLVVVAQHTPSHGAYILKMADHAHEICQRRFLQFRLEKENSKDTWHQDQTFCK